MLRHPWRLFAVSLVVLLLAACQVTVQPPVFDPPIEATLSAQDTTSPQPRASNVTVQAGQTLYFRVNVPTARDLLYGEAVGSGLRVRWLTTAGSTLAVSESERYFAGSVGALGAAAGEAMARPSAIDVQFNCDGPCVAIVPTASSYYLSVHNTTNGTRSFDLYAYTFAANDLNDRGTASNQTAATATPITTTGTESGAIETIGDRDWFVYTGASGRILEFSVFDPDLGLLLRFQDGTELTGTPGDATSNLFTNDRFEVFSATGRAGPSGAAGYFIEIRNP
jgi:hypothetical protein